jgi:GTPase SAR1 family protein
VGYSWYALVGDGGVVDDLGQEEFDRLRTLSYADTHVIMLCFAVESRDSLENVEEKWWDEIARHCEGTSPLLPTSLLPWTPSSGMVP